ncbi:ABC transporter permease subunit [bacterium]|nr:ABC transporter permease subunit [bacterium]
MKLTTISEGIVVLLALFFGSVLMTGVFSVTGESLGTLLSDGAFIGAILFSLKTSLIATLFAFFTGVPAGFYLARNKSGISRLLDALFDIPIVIPPLIIGVLLLTFFNLEMVKSVYPFIFSTAGATVAQFFIAVPFTIKSSKNAFELVPPVYERIAMSLGAKPFRSFYDTTFKIAFPGILSGLILTWLRCMGEFGATLMVAGGIPGRTENIPINVYLHISSGDFDKGITASMTAVFLSLICVIIINLFFLKQKNRGFQE